jgi:hypothetical protein
MAALLLSAALIAPTGTATATPPPLTASAKETGQEPSAYRGKYFSPADERYRVCVAQREGRHQYWVTGSNGMYQGTYQMTRALVSGAVWMAAKEWRELYGPRTAKAMRVELHATDPREYSREVWDQLFWTVLNWDGPRSGAHHWAGGRFSCSPGMTNSVGSR